MLFQLSAGVDDEIDSFDSQQMGTAFEAGSNIGFAST